MRISPKQHQMIVQIVRDYAGHDATVTLFGSRVDDNQRGGDVDLLITLERTMEDPAWLSAQISSKISRSMHGRHVDILLSAPNLQQLPIHGIARQEGIEL
jgi:hypothetical protein